MDKLMKSANLDEHIRCALCQDYLSDAVVLTDCLHRFCRSCLLHHLSSSSTSSNIRHRCPKCSVELISSEPAFRRDLKLQELVYRLVPDIFWRQLRRAARRRHRSSASDSAPSERRLQKRKMLLQLSTQLCSPNEKISIQLDYVSLSQVLAANNEEVEGQPSNNSTQSMEPAAQHKFRRFFRCPAKVGIKQLKRLLESKLAMSDSYGVYFVDHELKNLLEDDYSIEDLVHLFNWTRQAPLKIYFTLARLTGEEEDRPPVLEEMPQLDLESGPMESMLEPIEEHAESAAFKQKTSAEHPQQREEQKPKEPSPPKSTGKVLTSLASSDSPAVPSSSPPANSGPIARLSTAGVSPLRPVPSLLGNFAPSTSTPAVDQHPSPAKKRRRSSTTTAANTKKEQQKPATELHLSEKIMQQPLVEENKGITVKESQMEKPKADENQLLGKKMKGEEEQKEQAEKKEEMKSPAQDRPQNPQPTPESQCQQHSKPQTPPPKPKRQRPPRKKVPKNPVDANLQPQASASLLASKSAPPKPSAAIIGVPVVPPPPQPPNFVMPFSPQQQYAANAFMQSMQQNQRAGEARNVMANVFQGMGPQQLQVMQQFFMASMGMASMAVKQPQQAPTLKQQSSQLAKPKTTNSSKKNSPATIPSSNSVATSSSLGKPKSETKAKNLPKMNEQKESSSSNSIPTTIQLPKLLYPSATPLVAAAPSLIPPHQQLMTMAPPLFNEASNNHHLVSNAALKASTPS